jgi:hypothetical protein
MELTTSSDWEVRGDRSSNACVIPAPSQHLKHVLVLQFRILGSFSVLICIALIWACTHILTASGAHKHSSLSIQINCRTDRTSLIATASWSVIPPIDPKMDSPLFLSRFHDFDRNNIWKNSGFLGSTGIGVAEELSRYLLISWSLSLVHLSFLHDVQSPVLLFYFLCHINFTLLISMLNACQVAKVVHASNYILLYYYTLVLFSKTQLVY